MIEGLKPYPEYKDSSVDWIGQVPIHWEVIPGRACYYEKNESNTGLKEKTVLSLSYGKIVVKPTEKLHGLVPESFETYQIVNPGDIIIRPTDLQNDWNSLRFGISHNRGIITSAYLCFHTREIIDRNYGHLLLHTYDLNKVFYGLGSGLRQNLSWRDFKYLPCLVPPLTEQKEIVHYIEFADRQIFHLISAKRRLVELLNEQKRAIISHAITRGIDPNVRLKPSGIEWLGNVPEHWDVLKGRACYQEKNEPNVGLKEKTVLSLSYGKIVVKPEEKLHGLVPASFESYQIVNPGDIICRPTDLQNDWNSLRFGISNHRGIITSAYICFHTTDLLDRRYGHLLLHTFDLNKVFYGLGSGLRQNLGWKDFKDLLCLIPPLPEQLAIVKFVENATIELDDIIAATKSEIDLLVEYRTRIISDVVTGKVDIQGVEIKTESVEDVGEAEITSGFEENCEDDEKIGTAIE